MNATSLHTTDNKSAWRNPFGIALVVYYLVMAVLGLLIPDDILKSNAWAREFSDFMASIVPQIDRITALNIKPDVNRFYFSVLWVGSPVLFLLCAIVIWTGRLNPSAIMWKLPLLPAVAWMLFLGLAVWAAQNGYWITDTTNRQLRLLLVSTTGRSFWGSAVYVHGTSIFGAMLILWLFGWLTGYIPRNIKKQKNGGIHD